MVKQKSTSDPKQWDYAYSHFWYTRITAGTQLASINEFVPKWDYNGSKETWYRHVALDALIMDFFLTKNVVVPKHLFTQMFMRVTQETSTTYRYVSYPLDAQVSQGRSRRFVSFRNRPLTILPL